MTKFVGSDSKKTSTKSSSLFRSRRVGLLLVILALVGGLIYLGIRYNEAQQDIKRLSNPTESAKQETQDLISKVGSLVELPKNEEPTIATVKDVNKLQNQAFFKNAKNGDKVLIYTQAKKAVLYRPSTNKVIEVAPVNLGNDSKKSTTTTDESTTETPSTTSTETNSTP